MKITINYILLTYSIFLFGCMSITSSEEYPEWLEDLIAKYKIEDVGNPPQSVWQFEYKGQIVYYVPPQCCDQFSTLYDFYSNVICAPDGGISGNGDGACTDIFQVRRNEKLIWQDTRKRE